MMMTTTERWISIVVDSEHGRVLFKGMGDTPEAAKEDMLRTVLATLVDMHTKEDAGGPVPEIDEAQRFVEAHASDDRDWVIVEPFAIGITAKLGYGFDPKCDPDKVA